jgi:hypothetical protein
MNDLKRCQLAPHLSVNRFSKEALLPETKQQNYSNHARFDPAFHFFLMPVLLITLIATIVHLVMVPFFWSAWLVVLSITLIVIAGLARHYALKVQDRVIRLEERMRLSSLLPEPLHPRVWDLTERQLIALRFAPDAEVPELVARTLQENLEPKQIKQAIQNWRADHFRV